MVLNLWVSELSADSKSAIPQLLMILFYKKEVIKPIFPKGLNATWEHFSFVFKAVVMAPTLFSERRSYLLSAANIQL